MDTVAPERKCLLCQSKNLQYGEMGYYPNIFKPDNKIIIWKGGYAVHSYVCLDCGTTGSYLSESDVQDLRKYKEKKK